MDYYSIGWRDNNDGQGQAYHNATDQSKRKTQMKMTKTEAERWVRSHGDDDKLADDELEAAFTAIFGREADDEDREQGLWSHLCAAAKT